MLLPFLFFLFYMLTPPQEESPTPPPPLSPLFHLTPHLNGGQDSMIDITLMMMMNEVT